MMKESKTLMAGFYFLFVVCSIAYGQSRLTVNTKMNGKDAVFAFDTGTSVSLVLFKQTAERFNLDTSEQKRLKIAHFEFEIGTSKLKAEALVIDTPPMDVDGLIGWPFLQGKVWAVLWNNKTLARIQSVPEQVKSWLQIDLATDVPVLAFAEGDRDKDLIFIDTGDSGGVSLSATPWKRWLKEHPNAPMTLSAGWSPAFGGFSVERESWSDQLKLGALMIPGTTVSRAGHKWPRVKALIGLEALSHFDVVFDLKESRIYLKRRDGDHLEPEYNRLGATFVPESMDSADLVAKVLRNSPGYECGIRNGDILLKVDKFDMTKWRTDPIIWKRRFWYAEPGTQYNLELERGGKRIDLQVTLEEIFPVGRNKKKHKKSVPANK
jgi:hypothetical protein